MDFDKFKEKADKHFAEVSPKETIKQFESMGHKFEPILPLKWAVEITSPKDAERLQTLFPDANDLDLKSYKERFDKIYQTFSVDHTKGICYSIDGDFTSWGNKNSFIRKGYTIYTITELETIINER